jgi:hypothetical protein
MGAATKARSSRGVKYKPASTEEGSGDASDTSSSTRAARRAIQQHPRDNYKMVWTAQAQQRKSILVARNESYPSLSTESHHSVERRKRGNQVRTLSTPARTRSLSMGTRRMASGEFHSDQNAPQRTESFSMKEV